MRHWLEQTLLYQFVGDYYPAFKAHLTAQGSTLPPDVEQECEHYLQCGRLEHGFLRVRCESCPAEHLVAFGCKRRSFCPGCGARRMAESAALLVDEVFPEQPVRSRVTPVKRGRGGQHATTADPEEPTPAERRAAMTWAQRLGDWPGGERTPSRRCR